MDALDEPALFELGAAFFGVFLRLEQSENGRTASAHLRERTAAAAHDALYSHALRHFYSLFKNIARLTANTLEIGVRRSVEHADDI